MINPSFSSLFQPELQPGERILWTGQPEIFPFFSRADIFLVPFTLVWFTGVFPIIGDVFSPHSQSPFPVSLFPLFFLFIGFYMAIGRFIFKYFKKKKTYYAVSDKRVLTLSTLFGQSLQSAFIATIPSINKTVNSRGVGSLIFGGQSRNASYYNNTGLDFFGAASCDTAPAFFDIKNVNEVYERVNKLRNNG